MIEEEFLILWNVIFKGIRHSTPSNQVKSGEIMARFKFWNNQIRARFIQGKYLACLVFIYAKGQHVKFLETRISN